MKRIAVLSTLLLSLSLCVLAHSHDPTVKDHHKFSYVKKSAYYFEVKLEKEVALNDWLVIELVTPASAFRTLILQKLIYQTSTAERRTG
jgi:hypothetical protein